MINFSMNTFLKICLLDTGGRISETQKRLDSTSGYNFYKPLKIAVKAHCKGDDEEVENILSAPTNEIEREYNKQAFEKFADKFGAIKSLDAISSVKKIDFLDADISVSVEPLFELTKSGGRHIYSLWPTQKPALTQRYGAVACHLMRMAFADDALGNGSFYLADLVSNKVYSEKQITDNTRLILASDVTSIGRMLKEL